MPNLENINSEIVEGIGRFYYDDGFRFPSVTTVLQVVGDKQYLEDWREKVGDEWADAYTKIACDIGSAMHDDYEQYLSGNPLKIVATEEEKKARAMFKSSLIRFKSEFKKPLMQEVAVISKKLKVAGRFDLLVEDKKGRTILLDFKNTKRDKTVTDIDAYKYQLAFYNEMLKETYPEYTIDEHVVFMVNREGFVKIFRFSPDDVPMIELMKIRGRFFKEFGF